MNKQVSVFAQVCELPDGELGLKVLEIDFGGIKASTDECLKYPVVKFAQTDLLREKISGHDIKKGNTYVVVTLQKHEKHDDKLGVVDVAFCETPYYSVTELGEMVGIMAQKFAR